MYSPALFATSIIIASAVCFVPQAHSGETADVWAGQALAERTSRDLPAPPSLEVVKQSYLSQLGIRKSVLQTPLCIQDRKYERGIGTYATSEIIVRLPGPGRTFQAEIGIDNNIQTKGSLGSAIFVVEVAGKELFRSGVMHGSDAPTPVKVDLGSAVEFVLRVLDAGDGPEYDEADWADAFVTMQNGEKLQLDEFSVALAPAQFSPEIPFSFVYDGRPSSELLPGWRRSEKRAPSAGGKQKRTVTFADPATGLEIACETTTFDGFSAADWVVYLRNTGTSDTPIIENIQAMDLRIGAPSGGDIVFHHSNGSTATAADFLPIDDKIASNTEVGIAPFEGRSSDTTLPFFNVQWPGGGVVGGIGWTGQWSMRLRRDAGTGLALQAGQQTTHLRLHPGETIRTPRMLLVAWRGDDPIAGHNQFRRLLVKHYLPRVNGEIVTPPITQNSWFPFNANGVNEQNQLDLIQVAASAGVECYWLDAGWFGGGWSQGVGNWFPRADAFPHGLKPLADAAHKKGMKFILWYEPERVCPGTQIAREHPEWVMHVRPGEEQGAVQNHENDLLFRLGDPAARVWLTDLLSKSIEESGADIYRQDFNIFGATAFWDAADAPDRQGIAENMYVQGLYAMWDELVRRHPGLWIDNCASGGRRIDLETLSRSLPLWRSDSQCCGMPMPIQDEVQTAGLSLYVPLHAASVWSFDPYEWRSVATGGTNLCMDYRAPVFDMVGAKRAIKEAKALRQFWIGDYYPITGINEDESQWCAWQFDRPDLGSGFAMYFRRPKSKYMALEAGLRGLDPKATYEVTFVDTGKRKTIIGRDLAKMPVMVDKLPGSVLITYSIKR